MFTIEEMNDKLNKIHCMDCLSFMREVPDKYFEVIYIDPPYFEVKGEFDFVWKSFDDYLAWMETLAKEFKRILADNGSIFIWGHAKKIAYTQIIFDKYLNLENNLVWKKTVCNQNRFLETDQYNSFPPITERCLFYSNEIDDSSNSRILKQDDFKSLMNYFMTEREKAGFSYKQCDDFLGIKASYCYWDKPTTHPFRIPDKIHYEKLQTLGHWLKPYSEILKEYESIKESLQHLARPFINKKGLSDVLEFSQESHITKNYSHPTQKPPTLTGELLRVVTMADSKVYIPFCGSGTEAEQCKSLGLDWVATEINLDYVAIANKRLEQVQGSLF